MKIIHTSDWHLGRSFGPLSLQADQEAFGDWFVGLVADEAADLVVLAGDLYDRAIAPVESIELFRSIVGRLLSVGAAVAAITGNHDGADRVAPYAELLDRSGFYLRGGYDRIGSVITHQLNDGPLDLVLLPYLDPRAAGDDFGEDEESNVGRIEGEDAGVGAEIDRLLERRRARTHESVLATAIDLARASCNSSRSIAVAHAFVVGGEESDSERQLVVGGTGAVDASIFGGFSYVALGHLHRAQQIGGTDRVRYSGTPLAYSFSEAHEKSVSIIELDVNGERRVRSESVPVGRSVATIEGTIDELLDPSAHREAHDAFVRAVITDRETVLDARARLAAVYPFITEIQLRPDGRRWELSVATAGVDRLDPIDATREFWEASEGSPPAPGVDELLVDAVTRARSEIDA